METLENRANEVEDESIVNLARKVFKGALKSKIIYNKKEVKFYHIDGVKMSSLALNFSCDDGSGIEKECQGCSSCIPDRMEFGNEYNRLTDVYKENALNQFFDIANKSSKKREAKELDI
jgi:hypothetical protein